jgi:hypothetical protein
VVKVVMKVSGLKRVRSCAGSEIRLIRRVYYSH